MRTLNRYVVTALELSKGYRVTLSQRMTLNKAESFNKHLEEQLATAIPEYKFFADLQIEKCQPEYV